MDSFWRGFLECGICFSAFNEPTMLPCLHTFCRECIGKHIIQVTSQPNHCLRCPKCRKHIEISKRKLPVQQWADQFRGNFLIRNLLEKVSNEDDNPTHTQVKTCEIHSYKTLEYFCVDCDLRVCFSCLSLHSACAPVIKREEAVNGKRDEMKKFYRSFCVHLDRLDMRMVEQQKEKAEFQKQCCVQKQQIRQHAAFVIRQIKEEEKKCLDKLKRVYGKYSKELDVELNVQQGQIHILNKFKDATDSLIKHDDPHKLLDQYNILESSCEKLFSYKARTLSSEIQIRNIEFQKAWSVPSIGKVKLESGRRHMTPLPELPFPSASLEMLMQSCAVSSFHGLASGEGVLQLDKCLSTMVGSDTKQPKLCDVVAMAAGVVVVADEQNTCIKVFYTRRSVQKLGKLAVAHKPHNVCNYVRNMIAVTVPKARQIVFVSVAPILTLQNTLKTRHKYWGITAVGTDVFAVSTWTDSKLVAIHIIDLTGNILKCVHNGSRLLANPLYICTLTTGNIMVSDCKVPKVACLRQNGHVVFTCQARDACGLQKPLGVTDDGYGYIFLVDADAGLTVMDYKGNVTHVLQKGEGIESPQGVAVDPKGTVYIANANGRVGIFNVQTF